MSKDQSDLDLIADDLRAVLRHGLPVEPDLAVGTLVKLPGVRGRATDPDDRTSCVKSLDGLLRLQIARLENTRLSKAVPLLFGAAPDVTGATLTQRRELAAAASGYEQHHFRKRVEPKIISLIAWQLRRDSEEYARNRAVAPVLMPMVGDPVPLPADVFAWEAVEHEEAVSRLWASVYALRAELLAVERIVSMGEAGASFTEVANRALWRVALVLNASEEYRSAYGDRLLHTDTDIAPSDLVGLAGWMPPIDDTTKQLLREYAARYEDRETFVKHLARSRRGEDVIRRWQALLMEHLAEKSTYSMRRNTL